MDLFVVKRFVGDEEHLAGAPSESILEKLHKKAEERKKQKQLKEKSLTSGEENQQNEAEEEGRKEKKRKKKKRKYSEGGEDKRREEERRKMSRLEENGDGEVEVEEGEVKVGREIDERQSKVNGDEDRERQNNGDKIEQVAKKKKKKKEKTEKLEKREEVLEGDVEENTKPEELDETVTKKRKNKRKKKEKKTLLVSSDDVGENSATGDERTMNGEVKGEVGENEGNDEGLFPVLGGFSHSKKQKVQRVLPDWLAFPSRISGDIQNHSVSLDSVPGLDERILAALKEMEISTFFPVQEKVIPMILQSARHGIYMGPGGYRPGDLCVAAPTGSGKTLAFAVPIVQILIGRVVQHFRALVVLPTKNLASQVYKVFLQLCHKTPLQVVMIGGQRSIQQEEVLLVKKSSTGEMLCGGDILVATPGRLIDHINWTKGFSLKYLRFLVIDEADSMMVRLSKDWITRVENAVFGERDGQVQDRHLPPAITVESESRMEMPLQKILFSATLSHNPEQLMQLKLFQPQLVTSVISPDQKPTNQVAPKNDNQDHGNYIIPSGLEEHYIVCTSGEKPLIILHMLKNLGFTQVLCFTNSVESSHRLCRLMELMGGITVGEFSSKLSNFQRQAMIKQFKNDSIQLLICSDAMTRGMDLSNVRYVVSYDPPLFLKTYIHRVGRTARAGRKGTAYTILLQEEKEKFHKIMGSSSSKRIQEHIVTNSDLEVFMDKYEKALKKLSVSLKGEAYQQKNR